MSNFPQLSVINHNNNNQFKTLHYNIKLKHQISLFVIVLEFNE